LRAAACVRINDRTAKNLNQQNGDSGVVRIITFVAGRRPRPTEILAEVGSFVRKELNIASIGRRCTSNGVLE
jgi:hypothetical protein